MPKADDKMTAHREALKATYRTYANDFLTISAFADWLEVSEADARALVDMGRKYQSEDAAHARDDGAITEYYRDRAASGLGTHNGKTR